MIGRDRVGVYLLGDHYSRWFEKALGVVSQFITVWRDWWAAFIGSVAQSDIVISSARAVSLERLQRWFAKQIAPALTAIQYVMGDREFNLSYTCECYRETASSIRPIDAIGGG